MSKRFRLLSMFMVSAMLVLSFTGCAPKAATPTDSTDSAATEDQAAEKKVKIGVVVQTLQANVYVVMKDNAVKKAEELGDELIFQDSNLNAATQKNQVENMMAQGIDVLVMEPADAASMAVTAQAVRDAGKKVINLEQRISNFKADLWIVADSFKVGEMQVESFVKVWGTEKPANIVLLPGTVGDEVAESITKGVESAVAKYPNLKIVYKQNVQDWDRQKAMNYMEDAMVKQGGKIDAVIANNDGMMLGALKAAENADVSDRMWFIGADNDLETNQAILAGKNVMTVDKGAIVQGQRIAEAAHMLANGQTPPSDAVLDGIPVWYTPIQQVTKDTAKEVSGPKYPELFQ